MPRGARLLVAERVIPPGNLPSESKLFDINMLVTVGGRARTEAEYASLFPRGWHGPDESHADDITP